MHDECSHHVPVVPPPAPSAMLSSRPAGVIADRGVRLDSAPDVVSGLDDGIGFLLNDVNLPAPWFIYSFMASKALHCGNNELYTLLVTVLLLIEAALVAFIAFDRQWEEILPFDPTGELDSLRSFIRKNVEICKWVGIAAVIIQTLALLLSFILRALVSPCRGEFDYEDDYENARIRTREPLLSSHSGQTSAGHSDLWSSLVREKYGLKNGDTQNLLSPKASGSMKK